jgi:hypothetical protein
MVNRMRSSLLVVAGYWAIVSLAQGQPAAPVAPPAQPTPAAEAPFQFEREFAALRERNRRDPRSAEYDRKLGMHLAQAMSAATKECVETTREPRAFRAILRITAGGAYRMDFEPITAFTACFVATVERRTPSVPEPPSTPHANPFTFDFAESPPAAATPAGG